MRLPLIAITLLLASGLAPSQAPGPDHIFVYVDQNGPGPGSGTAADPFLTLLDAMNYVWEHDYVFVRPGIYQEVVNIPYFVFLRSVEGPERTVIDATGLPGTHAVTMATLAELTGFTVTKRDGAGVLAEVPGGAQAPSEFGRILRGNRIVGCPQGGLELIGPCHPLVVENVIAGNGAFGVRVADGASPWFAGNTVSQNPIGLAASGAPPDANAAFANSIVFGNGVEAQGIGPARLRHCIVGSAMFAGVNGNLDADPLFLDPAGLDFRLRSGSPGVDAADDQLVPYSSVFDGRGLGALRRVDGDRDGTTRADIGAFERGGLQVRQVGTGVGSAVHLEIDAAPGTTWFLGTGLLTDNPTAPVPGAFGYLFLEAPSLSLVATAPAPPGGTLQLVVPIADPLLLGARFALQAATLGALPPMPSTAFTNAEVLEIQ